MKKAYKQAIKVLKKIAKTEGGFPTVAKWNQLAKENHYLSHVSIEYISGLNWHGLRDKIKSL